MGNYKPDLSCKSILIQVDFIQQIIPGTFEYALSHIVDKHIDLSLFDKWYDNDKGGAAAYPPSVMLKIVLFGYSGEVVSSRFKKFVTI
ncbi:transposase [Psychromonas sp. GE-S-Ul-11]|uniref:transposase n=1 Tax=Psychromonas sp. GE-S-Ul-11 TaxID=3241170 RepID=UPI00390CC45C